MVSPITNSESKNIYFDLFFNWQIEEKLFGPIRSLFQNILRKKVHASKLTYELKRLNFYSSDLKQQLTNKMSQLKGICQKRTHALCTILLPFSNAYQSAICQLLPHLSCLLGSVTNWEFYISDKVGLGERTRKNCVRDIYYITDMYLFSRGP